MVDLRSATLRSLTGSYSGVPNGLVNRKTLPSFWQDAVALNTSTRGALVVVNGTFFSTASSPAPIAFGLKVNGAVISYGYGLTEFPGLVRMLAWTSTSAEIRAYDRAAFDAATPNVVGALDKTAAKSPTSYVGRTFVGVRDADGDGHSETVLLFSSPLSCQMDAANTLRGFGASIVAMLDGGGSTGLIVAGTTLIPTVRTVPHSIAAFAGR